MPLQIGQTVLLNNSMVVIKSFTPNKFFAWVVKEGGTILVLTSRLREIEKIIV